MQVQSQLDKRRTWKLEQPFWKAIWLCVSKVLRCANPLQSILVPGIDLKEIIKEVKRQIQKLLQQELETT